VRYPALPKGKRLTAAKLAGHLQRVAWGNLRDLPFPRKVEDLWAITRDPEILGHELGPYLAEEPPTAGGAAAIELLRAAGADEAVGERNAAWQRERRAREHGGPRA